MADNVAITAGTGTTVATDEVGGVHYQRVKVAHGADGAATDVSQASPMPVGGAAADDAAAAGNPVPIGGVYQETIDELNVGDIGYVRMTLRRVPLVARDFRRLYLNSADPSPVGGDIRLIGGAEPDSGDFDIRDTTSHVFTVPMGNANYQNVHIVVVSSGFDQSVSFYLSTGYITLMNCTIPASVINFACSPLAVGQGGTVGGAVASSGAHYAVPALAQPMETLFLTFTASVAPSVGSLSFFIERST